MIGYSSMNVFFIIHSVHKSLRLVLKSKIKSLKAVYQAYNVP